MCVCVCERERERERDRERDREYELSFIQFRCMFLSGHSLSNHLVHYLGAKLLDHSV